MQQEYNSLLKQREEEQQKSVEINSVENKKPGSRSNDSSTLSSIENQRSSK